MQHIFVGKFSSLRRHKDTYFITIAPNVFGSFGLQAVNAGIESNAVTVQPFTIVIIVSTSRKTRADNAPIINKLLTLIMICFEIGFVFMLS